MRLLRVAFAPRDGFDGVRRVTDTRLGTCEVRLAHDCRLEPEILDRAFRLALWLRFVPIAARLRRLQSALGLMQAPQARSLLLTATSRGFALADLLRTGGTPLLVDDVVAVISRYLAEEVIFVAFRFDCAPSSSWQELALRRVRRLSSTRLCLRRQCLINP